MNDLSAQENFLDFLEREGKAAVVITINGYQMVGRITCHDQHTVMMAVNGQRQLVYKTAISTIKEV